MLGQKVVSSKVRPSTNSAYLAQVEPRDLALNFGHVSGCYSQGDQVIALCMAINV